MFFFSMLFYRQVNFITVIIVIIINSSIITIINAFVIRNFTLSSLLPLSLVFLLFFLLLILLYLFVVVSYFQCCYSYQVKITIIVSLVIVSSLNLHFCFSLWVSASQVFFLTSNSFSCLNSQTRIVFVHCLVYLFTLLLLCFLSRNHRLKIGNVVIFVWLPWKLKFYLFILYFDVVSYLN